MTDPTRPAFRPEPDAASGREACSVRPRAEGEQDVRSVRLQADDQPRLVDRAAARSGMYRTLLEIASYRHLLRNLVLKELKLKYRGSVLGFVWSLGNPLLMIAVYTIAFTYILRLRTPGFVFYVMLGILAWTFFTNAISMSAGAIVDNGALLRAVWFPRAILPAATVFFNLAQYLLTIVVFLPIMMAIYGVRPAAPMLAYPVFLVLQTGLTIGIALVAAVGTAYYRDVRHFIDVALPMLFWVTPIVYELSLLSGRVHRVIALMPMSPYVSAYHDVFYYTRWPSAGTWAAATIYAAASLAIGLTLMARVQDRLTERV